MKPTRLMLAAVLAAPFAHAFAQEAAPNVQLVPRSAVRAVANAPYSAQMVTERQQNLADGNQIAERHTTMSYRDGAGRTRQEVGNAKGELAVVTIHDPVAGKTWILRPQDRSATLAGSAAHWAEVGRRAGEAARLRIEQMRKDGSLPGVERRKGADGSEEIVIKRVQRAEAPAAADSVQNVRIQVRQPSGQFELAPMMTGVFGDARWSARATTKDLGMREIGGVKAEGKLRSYEIPAGEIGNRNPIVVSDETWTAPELQVTVYSKHSDPRSGEVVSRIENLKRGEPAASLFSVPADYVVKDPLGQLQGKAQ
jgi:hypothetical protein